ncbi:sigma-70 family rna polymerase sigma factor : RNA polymerase sigma factor, sigma-70 family OS=Singulisphaera acidiphila (strain ATCC BAA-1392 / DSM 18658 / VKM B-2454 / MOB10) GN=Sinac_3827 PE=4 SV=1: Sigma70_r2 [Gemmata massiliana]|uniref:RNA polymerase sigma-70 region 2 domain-containing protein n=1 Tax=Gemmata massiliana TaxID=1210884 RepID=A0A6P2D711_9BACT|nr:sigma-70 family RNA polymerase sigma factor [Gemmata massiliana]VTR95924.1 sigma-70 family rna polymerase sigma factor : RNA polymerase sigma factor, sigma-70 family OS=Singulisphaera acidiphila (strain ATCC BAA-1392 / DSM 18658 / VKM B-2454 / MOB10) GN=Sinac_3827 PE=4 SV=1: Sigma70_r2 [Gemmata massiliana]
MAALLPILRRAERAEAPVSDAELLDRFGRARDESAFTELVRRHGPVVYRICRRLVGSAGADDAFQATFLVLATKLRAARASNALGGWLAGVAGRVARQMQPGAGRVTKPPRLNGSAQSGKTGPLISRISSGRSTKN